MSCNKPPPAPLYILRGHKGIVTALHFTNEVDDVISDKPSLISGSDSGEIFIWSIRTGRTYHRFEGHNGKMILYLRYYKSCLISQGRDGCIHEWKCTEKGWNVIRSFNCSGSTFCASSIFPMEDQVYLVTPTGDEQTMTFYNYETSKVLKQFPHKLSSLYNTSEMCMCMKLFTKEAKIYFLIGHDNGFVSLWHYNSDKELSRLRCHPEIVTCFDYNSQYKHCGISASVDDSLQVWKIDEKEQLVKSCSVKITNPGISAIKIRSDGKIVITAGKDKSIRIFSWKNLKPLAVLSGTVWHREPVTCLSISDEPFRKYTSILASGSKDKNICVFSIY